MDANHQKSEVAADGFFWGGPWEGVCFFGAKPPALPEFFKPHQGFFGKNRCSKAVPKNSCWENRSPAMENR